MRRADCVVRAIESMLDAQDVVAGHGPVTGLANA